MTGDPRSATYRVMRKYEYVYAGEDIEAAIAAFATAVNIAVAEVDAPYVRVRCERDTSSVASARGGRTDYPLICAYLVDDRVTTPPPLAAILYGVTREEWQARAPKAITNH